MALFPETDPSGPLAMLAPCLYSHTVYSSACPGQRSSRRPSSLC